MLRTSVSIFAIALAATPALAQELTYGNFGLEYQRLSEGGDDLDTTIFNGDVEFTVDQFLFGAGVLNSSPDGFGSDLSILSANLFAAYAPLPEFMIGAGLLSTSLESDFSDDDFTGYEVFAQYRTPTFGGALLYTVPDSDEDDLSITALYGEAEVTPGATLGAIFEQIEDIDETFYILSAEWDQGPIDARAFYQGVSGEDFYIAGVRGGYNITDMYGVTASVSVVEDFISDELTAYSIGGFYEFTEGFVAEASIGRLEAEGDELDSIQIALTYEIGGRQRLDTEMRADAADDRRESIGALLPEFGFSASGFLF